MSKRKTRYKVEGELITLCRIQVCSYVYANSEAEARETAHRKAVAGMPAKVSVRVHDWNDGATVVEAPRGT